MTSRITHILRTHILFVLVLFASTPAASAAQELDDASGERTEESSYLPGEDLRVWLVTAGPGHEIWERYGHNALRVLNTRTGRDISYNWGIFDFKQVSFVSRFLQGRMLYRMGAFQTDAMVDMYTNADRRVVLQELNLTPAQKQELQTLAAINALPDNREYIYQYYLDNCSTRIRNILDLVLSGALEDQFRALGSHATYRDHTREFTQADPLISTGVDLLLGEHTDAPISVWEEMFLPLTLRDQLRNVRVTGPNGGTRPLVISEQVGGGELRTSEPPDGLRWFLFFLLGGLGLGLAFAALALPSVQASTPARRALTLLALVWTISGGILGSILVLLLFTDHTFAYRNENLFLFNPLLLGLAATLVLSSMRPRWRPVSSWLALTIAAVGGLGLVWQIIPTSQHQNAMFFALALPAHLGMAWGLLTSTGQAGSKKR
jgi:hypothetical protein